MPKEKSQTCSVINFKKYKLTVACLYSWMSKIIYSFDGGGRHKHVLIKESVLFKATFAQFSASTHVSLGLLAWASVEASPVKCAIYLNWNGFLRTRMSYISLLSYKKMQSFKFSTTTLFWHISNIIFIEKVRSTILDFILAS